MREPGLKSEGGWPSKKLRLTLLISFGGLLALMVVAGLDALRLARQLHTQEEADPPNLSGPYPAAIGPIIVNLRLQRSDTGISHEPGPAS